MQKSLEQFIAHGHGIWRYRWYAMATAWVIVLIGWIVLSRIPNEYTASAQVHVDTYTILKPLLKGLTANVEDEGQQLGLMTQLMTSRSNLEQVARLVGVDRQSQTPQQFDAFLGRLQKAISIEGTSTVPRATYLDLYTISYSDPDPEMATRMVQALITTFIDNILGKGRQDAKVANQFLDQQIKEYEAKLNIAEDRLREFKRQHIDVLPGQEQDYFGRLQAALTAVQDVGLQIREAESQRSELQHQLSGTPAGQRAISIEGKPVLTPAEARLNDLQKRLDEMLLNYTDSHPDVVATRQMIAQAEKQRDKELKELASSNSSAAIANPEYQQIRLKLGEVEQQLATLKARREEYQRRAQSLQQQRETLPVVEAELQRLNRDYEVNKERYTALLASRESMKMSDDIRLTDEDIKFEVINQPKVSMWQTWRKRIMLITGVLLMGLTAGGMLAFVLSQNRPVVYTRRVLGELTGLPVFGTISQVWTPAMRRQKRLGLVTFALVGLIMIATYGAVIFLQINNMGLNGMLQVLGGSG